MKTQTLTVSWPWYNSKEDKPLYCVEKSSNPIAYKPGQKLTEQEIQRIIASHKWNLSAVRSK